MVIKQHLALPDKHCPYNELLINECDDTLEISILNDEGEGGIIILDSNNIKKLYKMLSGISNIGEE